MRAASGCEPAHQGNESSRPHATRGSERPPHSTRHTRGLWHPNEGLSTVECGMGWTKNTTTPCATTPEAPWSRRFAGRKATPPGRLASMPIEGEAGRATRESWFPRAPRDSAPCPMSVLLVDSAVNARPSADRGRVRSGDSRKARSTSTGRRGPVPASATSCQTPRSACSSTASGFRTIS